MIYRLSYTSRRSKAGHRKNNCLPSVFVCLQESLRGLIRPGVENSKGTMTSDRCNPIVLGLLSITVYRTFFSIFSNISGGIPCFRSFFFSIICSCFSVVFRFLIYTVIIVPILSLQCSRPPLNKFAVGGKHTSI